MVDTKVYKPAFLGIAILFVGFTGWWLVMQAMGNPDYMSPVFSALYGLTALFAGVYGLFAARSWGYWSSDVGKAIILLSVGLLLQEFGQLSFSYMHLVQGIEVPYPSIPDIGFFGTVPMYIAGALYLAKGLGVLRIIKKYPLKLALGILIPLIALSCSYGLFLSSYDFADKDALTVFLDFGYPLGQAIYVSIALVTVFSVSGILGGALKWPIILLMVGFMAQYAADFNFLYQVQHETWATGAYGDYLYLFAYFVMGVSLPALNRGLSKVFSANAKLATEEKK
jgi:hypothetical protein